jgi:hypothetical protein
MGIQTTGISQVDQATAEIAVALRDASPGHREQGYCDEAMRLRDAILNGTDAVRMLRDKAVSYSRDARQFRHMALHPADGDGMSEISSNAKMALVYGAIAQELAKIADEVVVTDLVSHIAT